MKILISYGHDYTELVKRVKDDLTSLGYEVWLDIYDIHAGDDWRQKIESGIRESSLVLSFLSAHAIRSGGVCLDELKIASYVGCPIRTILLEEGIRDSLPTFLRGIQYLDMTDIGEHYRDENSPVYDGYFDRIVDMIEGGDYTRHKEIVEVLATKLHPDRSILSQMTKLKNNFCERPSIDEKVDFWKKNGHNLAGIIGFPGSGKSYYCAHSFFSPDSISSIVFCKWFRGKNAVAKVLKNVAYQIATKLSAYAKRLLWILDNGDADLSAVDNVELFDILVTEPLSLEIDGNHRPILIVVDGIDELNENNGNELIEIISSHVDRLPRFVHFIVTTRNNTAVTRCLVGRQNMELLPEDKKVAEDVYNYLSSCLSDYVGEDDDVILRALTAKCHGSFLYASLLVESIVSGAISIDDTEKYPERIFDFYYHWMLSLVPDEEEFAEKYYDVFSILVAVRTPVSLRILLSALGWKRPDWIKFAKIFKSFVYERKTSDGETVVELFHSSFAEWMGNEDGIADIYYVDPEDGLNRYCDTIFEFYEKKGLKNSEFVELISILIKGNRKNYLKGIADDIDLLDGAIKYAGDCQANVDTYKYTLEIIDSITELSRLFSQDNYAKKLTKAKIPFLIATGEFNFGNLKRVESLLLPCLEDIRAYCSPEDYMEGLFLLGTSYDWLGGRKKSIEFFKNLYEEAEALNDRKYFCRALYGLVWNYHYNDFEEGRKYLEKISSLHDLEPQEQLTVELIRARMYLSDGKLKDSLKIYSDLMGDFGTEIWGYNREANRNQMLLLESIVALFDSGLYELAIEYGEQIYFYLKGRGNLQECYCASWLSLSYTSAGNIKKAEEYMRIADKLNCKSKRAIRSEWITMHLTSIRSNFYMESGEYYPAYLGYKEVERMAEECNDAWVMGDACYSLFVLRFLYGVVMSEEEETKYKNILYTLAEKSKLPHLIYKSKLTKMLLNEEKYDENVLTYLINEQLPSVDVVGELTLCKNVADRYGLTDVAERISRAIGEKIDIINRKNPHSNYNSRNVVKWYLSTRSDYNIEQCNPFDGKNENYWMKLEHCGRYLFAVDKLNELGAKKVLDLACAEGYGTSLIADRGISVVGGDVNEEYLKVANEENSAENIQYMKINFDEEDLADIFCEVDAIVSFETVEHLRYPYEFLKKLHSITKEGGLLILSVPNSKFEKFDEEGKNLDIYHLHVFERKEMEEYLAKVGYTVLSVLGQSECNKRLLEEEEKKGDGTATPIVHRYDRESIVSDSREYSYPSDTDVDESYSYIFVCKK